MQRFATSLVVAAGLTLGASACEQADKLGGQIQDRVTQGVDLSKDTIAYCRIGERSAHTWFVLHELLGQTNVKNYDGSWTEYGSLVGVPVALGDEAGEA